MDLKPLPAWLDLDERRSVRWPMNVAALLESEVHPAQIGVRVLDISTHGCLLVVPGDLALGRYVKLTLPALAIEGWIAWAKRGHAGLDYARALPPALVDRIINETRPPEATEATIGLT